MKRLLLLQFILFSLIVAQTDGEVVKNVQASQTTDGSKILNITLGIFLSVVIYYVNYFSSLLGTNGKIPIILSIWLPLIILFIISSIGLVRLNEK